MMLSRAVRTPQLLAAVLLCCCSVQVFGDEFKYLPNNFHIFLSFDHSEFIQSKTYQELNKSVPGFDKFSIGEEIGIPPANIARMTMAAPQMMAPTAMGKENPYDTMTVLTVVKPVVAAELIRLALKNSSDNSRKQNLAFKEIKVGKFTLYQESYQFLDRDDKLRLHEGDAFCVAENNIVLVGPLPAMRKILERNKAPELSPNLQACLKETGFRNIFTIILDVENLQTDSKKLVQGLALPGVDTALGKVRVVGLKATDGDKLVVSATAICKDAAGAADVRKLIDDSLAAARVALNDPNTPEERKDMVKTTQKFVDAVKVSVAGDKVTVAVAVEPVLAAQMLEFIMTPRKREIKK